MNVASPAIKYGEAGGKNPFADKRVRQAINMSIDREAIKRAVMLAPVAERDLVAHSLSGGPISAHWSPFDHAVVNDRDSESLPERRCCRSRY